MNDTRIQDIPEIYPRIQSKCKEIGFDMPSDLYIGTLLKTLIASKPGGAFLELGTGIGLSIAWMIAGMDAQSHLISIDNDQKLIALAMDHFGQDERIQLVCEDGAAWLKNYRGSQFDLIFADAWPGKYGELEEALALLKPGGFYVIDDMTVQPNWPEGHQANVDGLITYLENRRDLTLTKMNWSTGVIIAVKITTDD